MFPQPYDAQPRSSQGLLKIFYSSIRVNPHLRKRPPSRPSNNHQAPSSMKWLVSATFVAALVNAGVARAWSLGDALGLKDIQAEHRALHFGARQLPGNGTINVPPQCEAICGPVVTAIQVWERRSILMHDLIAHFRRARNRSNAVQPRSKPDSMAALSVLEASASAYLNKPLMVRKFATNSVLSGC